jgi:allantoate deiminase
MPDTAAPPVQSASTAPSQPDKINAAAAAVVVLDRCAVLARCTGQPGQICRTFLSPAMEQVHAHLRAWMHAAGMKVRTDRAGNIIGSLEAAPASAHSSASGGTPHHLADAPRLLIGSHLDTVPNAGAYDGVLGVLLGLALAEELGRRSTHSRTFAPFFAPAFALDVIGLSEEEGVRFGSPFLGSKAVVNKLNAGLLTLRDREGISLEQALDGYAASHPAATAPAIAQGTRAFLEFHIEQGPVLEFLGLPLGVVTAIAGQIRGVITFTGKAGHAGTTPMTHRRDALAAAAEWIGQVEALALAAPGLTATVGQLFVEPGAINVIPAKVGCSLDLRHADDAQRELALAKILDASQTIASRRGLRCDWSLTNTQAAVPMDAELVTMTERAVARAGYPAHRMVSGAGHDAMVLAEHLPSAMIFLRCPGGLSHHPEEAVLAGDVAAAIDAGLLFLEEFENATNIAAEPHNAATGGTPA